LVNQLTRHRLAGSSLYGWQVRPCDPKDILPVSVKRGIRNQRWSAIFRFADDFVVFVNTLEGIQIAIEAAEEFVGQRGMKLNYEKTLQKNLKVNEPFNFVGFTFKLRAKMLYNFPPVNKWRQPKTYLIK
jgi:Reverse transcriptase (RNA-dependent DNA polymerase)